MKKVSLFVFENKGEAWSDTAAQVYVKKISPFCKFEIKVLKSPSLSRNDQDLKKKKEAELLLKNLDKGDVLMLFDESGEQKSSVDFARILQSEIDFAPGRICFVIGGPYGFSDEVKSLAKKRVSLSKMTFNHHLALIVALEQIYRAFCINKGIPYHNA